MSEDIRKRIKEIEEEKTRLQAEINRLQKECKHAKANHLTWYCPDCGKPWRVCGSD